MASSAADTRSCCPTPLPMSMLFGKSTKFLHSLESEAENESIVRLDEEAAANRAKKPLTIQRRCIECGKCRIHKQSAPALFALQPIDRFFIKPRGDHGIKNAGLRPKHAVSQKQPRNLSSDDEVHHYHPAEDS